MEKSNARPPSATFYQSAAPRTKQLNRFQGTPGWGGGDVGGGAEGPEYLLKRHLNKQLKKEGLSRTILSLRGVK